MCNRFTNLAPGCIDNLTCLFTQKITEDKVNFNAADDAAFSLAPTTETGAFANPPTQVDFTNQVGSQCVGMSTRTYPAVPQNTLDPWSMEHAGGHDAVTGNIDVQGCKPYILQG